MIREIRIQSIWELRKRFNQCFLNSAIESASSWSTVRGKEGRQRDISIFFDKISVDLAVF